jgi:hypothetical protein
MLAGAELQCLLELGHAAEAAALGRHYQALAREHGIDYPAHYIDLALSLALSALGEFEAARALTGAVVEYLIGRNAHGVPLGLAFHNLALISLAAQDQAGFRSAAERCAEVFEHSSNQALATKYRRLMREARRTERKAGPNSEPVLTRDTHVESLETLLTSLFETCSSVDARARIAADVLARHYQAEAVFLFVPHSEVVSLVAAVGRHEPPPHLAEQVSEYLSSALGDSTDGAATATVTAAEGLSGADVEPLWNSDGGRRFYPVVLAHHEPSAFVVTAIAVVALDEDASFVHPGRMAAALSRLGFGAG